MIAQFCKHTKIHQVIHLNWVNVVAYKLYLMKPFKNKRCFPGGSLVKNLPASAEDTGLGRNGFDPWSGQIPHAAEQLSLCATTVKPTPDVMAFGAGAFGK